MKNRYDFIFLFDAQDANPNGDPDAGNLPRVDVESGHGLVTDVCLKRKIRNFIQTSRKDQKIYFTEGAIHNNQHDEAYNALKSSGDAADDDLTKEKKKRPTSEIKDKTTRWMCEQFYDVRTFGAVMSTDINCGQVRGPIQISFARSIDPIVTSEHAITRSSVTKPEDVQKERTMGRKFTIPYGLYLAKGFVNPFLAAQTGFDDEDLELLFTSLENAFQFDQSAARPPGSMNPRGLLVFKHDTALGAAPSHTLFDLVTVKKKAGVELARTFADYEVNIDEAALPDGVTLHRRI